MAETVSVYVSARKDGTLSVSVDIPLDLIQKVQTMESSIESDKNIEELAKNWMGTEVQTVEKTM